MRKVLSFVFLFFAPVFVVGCDTGNIITSQKVPSKLKVQVERLIQGYNQTLTVYAMDFSKEGRTLTFICPCHIPGLEVAFINVMVEGDSFKLTALPGAEYDVRVQYWAPNADGNTEVKFKISR